ncbi:M20/M25/M40 family metallo-hydrolase [Colwellia sp. MEBiC06753]
MKFAIICLCSLLVLGCAKPTSTINSSTYANRQNTIGPITKQRLVNYVEYLTSKEFLGRKTGTKYSAAVADFISQELHKNGFTPVLGVDQLQQHFEYNKNFSRKYGTNIAGMRVGVQYPEQYLILTAHYDHLGKKGRSIYYGADDNASGVAALLAFAEQLKNLPLNYSVILLFTDAEEVNLNGALAFIDANPNIINNTLLNINLDMIAGNKKTIKLHYIDENLNSILPDMAHDTFRTMDNKSPLKLKKGFSLRDKKTRLTRFNWIMASDHGAFYRHEIPFIYYGVGTHSNYHQPTDNLLNLNTENLWLASNLIYAQLLFLDKHLQNNASKS